MKAEMGTPCGSSQCGEIEGHWLASAVKREMGGATGSSSDSKGCPSQLSVPGGGVLEVASIPCHQGRPPGVRPTFVKTALCERAAIALGLVCWLVPGATPKKPFSGLTAQSRPSS